MAWYDPKEWFRIGGTGYNPIAERDKDYQDYTSQTDPFAEQMRQRMLGQGQLGAERQAQEGVQQQRRQAQSLAYSAGGVPAARAQRMAERAGDLAQTQAQDQVAIARAQDQMFAQQAMGKLLETQSMAAQQRAAIDQMYAQMGFQAARSDFETERAEDAGFLGFIGNAIASIF